MPNVSLSHDYFTKSLKDYRNWCWAWVRELIQNGVDAGSKNIWFEFHDDHITVRNDGPHMDQDTLVNKFLCLGGTTKSGQTTGGFGIAKTVICLAHKKYTIHTGNVLVTGAGGYYEIQDAEFVDGVTTTVWFDDKDDIDQIKFYLNMFCKYAQFGTKIWQDGVPRETKFSKGYFRKKFSFGSVYTKSSPGRTIIVRVNGQPMFVRHCLFDRCVVVEIDDNCRGVLQSNRDGLNHKYSAELDSFIDGLNVDGSTVLLDNPVYMFFPGSDPRVVTRVVTRVSVDVPANVSVSALDRGNSLSSSGSGVVATMNGSSMEFDMIIRNDTRYHVPDHLIPSSEKFSKYADRLIRAWTRMLVGLHKFFDEDTSFSVGFLFSAEHSAMFEKGNFGRVFYIAPCELVKGQWRRSVDLSRGGKYGLLSVALHEFVHGLGYTYHDASFAAKLTEYTGKVMPIAKSLA